MTHASIHILISASPALRVTAAAVACLSCLRVKVGLLPGQAARSLQGRKEKQYLEYLDTRGENRRAAHRKGLGLRTCNPVAARQKCKPLLRRVNSVLQVKVCSRTEPEAKLAQGRTLTVAFLSILRAN